MSLSADQTVEALRAAGEPTRLRVLSLLAGEELSVMELSRVLDQSQPRVSRHLKLMADAGLIERFPDGARVFYRVSHEPDARRLIDTILDLLDDAEGEADHRRLDAVREERTEAAAAYFEQVAPRWDRIRSLYVSETAVENAIARAAGPGPFERVVDLGTGSGRMLTLLGKKARMSIGLDLSQNMLNIARANVARAGLDKVELRHGDIFATRLPAQSADLVLVHQVLHYLADPAAAVAEAGRLVSPGGKLLIVDFAPHDMEQMREEHQHRRLGFRRRRDRALAGRGRARCVGLYRPAPRHGGSDRHHLDRDASGARQKERCLMPSAATSLADARALLLSPLGPVARAGNNANPVRVSFEFFPPKSDEAEANLWKSVRRLEPLNPEFVSVTYGAGGSTRERTHRTVQRHADRDDTQARRPPDLCRSQSGRGRSGHSGIQGDRRRPHRGPARRSAGGAGNGGSGIGGVYQPRADGYANATELAQAIQRVGGFQTSVGVYPEKHPESPSIEHDIDVLKAKIDAGATRALSQFFFDIDAFLRFRDRIRAAGVTIPLIPGIMPVSNFAGLQRMSASCGASVPAWLAAHFDGLDDDPETRKLLAASVAAETCARLQEEGFADFHFYTLNRADLVYAICRVLGVREQKAA